MNVRTTTKVNQRIAALRQMGPTQLREQYLALFGEPTKSGNREFLFKRIAWRVQAQAEGGLSERAKRRAEELARDEALRTTIPRPHPPAGGGRTVTLAVPVMRAAVGVGRDRPPVPGTVLTRHYKGRHVAVTVLADGFEW